MSPKVFVARPLGTVRRVLLASPALLAKMGHPDTPDALTDYPFAAVSGVFASNRIQLVASEDQLINVPVNIQFQSTHWRSVLSPVISGTCHWCFAKSGLQKRNCRRRAHPPLKPLSDPAI